MKFIEIQREINDFGAQNIRRNLKVRELIFYFLRLSSEEIEKIKCEVRAKELNVYMKMYMSQKNKIKKIMKEDEFSRRIFIEFKEENPCINYIHIQKYGDTNLVIINWRSSEFKRMKEDILICDKIIKDLGILHYQSILIFNNLHIYE
jgi:hypothetical protein